MANLMHTQVSVRGIAGVLVYGGLLLAVVGVGLFRWLRGKFPSKPPEDQE